MGSVKIFGNIIIVEVLWVFGFNYVTDASRVESIIFFYDFNVFFSLCVILM